MNDDVQRRLEEAAAESEEINEIGVILIYRALADEMISRGQSDPVRLSLVRSLPGVYTATISVEKGEE